MLPKEKIKPFLVHSISQVRDFAAGYFQNRNQQPEDLMDWVYQATDRYGPENCIGLLSNARQFLLNHGHFIRILNEWRTLPHEEKYILLRRQYEFLLQCAPAEFLRDQASEWKGRRFTEPSRNVLSQFLSLPETGAAALLKELNRTASSPNIMIGFTNFEYFYGRFLGYQLGLVMDRPFFDEMIRLCRDVYTSDGWRSILLQESLRSTPFRGDLSPLLSLLEWDEDGAVSDAVLFTIRAVGDERLLSEIFRLFPRGSAQFKTRALEAIETIKDESLKVHCLSCLAQPNTIDEVKDRIYICLAGLLSQDCLQVLEEAVERQDYDPELADLKETLLINQIILSGDLSGESRSSHELREYIAGRSSIPTSILANWIGPTEEDSARGDSSR
jgi:hypothetical protein